MRWATTLRTITRTNARVSVTPILVGKRMPKPHLQGASSKGCGLTRTFQPCISIGSTRMHSLNGGTGGCPLRWSGKRQGEGRMGDDILGAMSRGPAPLTFIAELNERLVGRKWDNTRSTLARMAFVISPA